jgi:hypothetical protein
MGPCQSINLGIVDIQQILSIHFNMCFILLMLHVAVLIFEKYFLKKDVGIRQVHMYTTVIH